MIGLILLLHCICRDRLIADAGAFVRSTVGIPYPAILFEDCDCRVGAGCIGFKEHALLDSFFVHPGTGVVRTVNNTAVTAGEVLRELCTIHAESDRRTDGAELSRTEVSTEAELAVTCAAVMRVDICAVGFVSRLQSFVGCCAAGNCCDNVKTAGLEVFELGCGNDLLVDNLIDARSCAFIVALEVLVSHKDCGRVGIVEGFDAIRTGPRICRIVFSRGIRAELFDSSGLNVLAFFVLCIELVGQVAAVAVVLDFNAFAEPCRRIVRGEAAVGDLIEVVRVVLGNGCGEGVVVDQVETCEFLGAFCAVRTGVLLICALPANVVAVGDRSAARFGRNRGSERHGEREVILRGDGAAVGELQVVLDLDREGQGAVLVELLFVRFNNGVVPLITALFVCGDGFETGGQTFDVVIGSTRVGFAERRITELAGELGGVTHDDGIVFLLRGPVDQRACNAPERVGRMLLNALDLCIVQIVVLVAVQRDFGKQVVPTGDVQSPPCRIRILFSRIRCGRGGVVNHCHGQEVETQQMIFAVHLDIAEALVIFRDIVNREAGICCAVDFIQGLIVLAVLESAELGRREFRRFDNVIGRNLDDLGCGLVGLCCRLCYRLGIVRVFRRLGLGAADDRENHEQSEQQCC